MTVRQTFLISRDLTPEECVHRLASTHVGRLAVMTPLGPRVSAVNYVVVRGTVVLCITPSGGPSALGWDGDLALEAGFMNHATREGWSVVLRGRAEVLDSHQVHDIRHGRDLDVGGGADREEVYVRLVRCHIAGREVAWSDESDTARARSRLVPTTP